MSWVPFTFWLMYHPWGKSSENMGYTSTHLLTTPSFIWLLMLTLLKTLSDALRSIQLAILDIKNWLSHNLLKFNIGKIELLLIGSCHQLSKLCSPITIRVDDVTITASEIVRNLGVFIDEQLKLDSHVNKIIKTCLITSGTSSKSANISQLMLLNLLSTPW